MYKKICCLTSVLLLSLVASSVDASSLASNNIPLGSPVYDYLEKLEGFGYIGTAVKGIRPYSKAEVVRLVHEAERNMMAPGVQPPSLATRIVKRLHELLPREIALYGDPEAAGRFKYKMLSGGKLRYVYLDGVPRSYERPVHDPGGDGVFGIGSGLRPENPYPSPVQQHGAEGTPLIENNEGIRYRRGINAEVRFSSEAWYKYYVSALVEPLALYSQKGSSLSLTMNKGYVKLGGGGLELELGRDANWLGIGSRTAITLSNNARNLDIVKLSSPEPVDVAWIKRYLGVMKYSLIFSQLDRTVTNGLEREPFFFGAKLAIKPADFAEIGINLGRQVGGPGVNNGFDDTIRGLIGGTNSDNSNSLAGIELRFRLPFLRNAEVYGEYSGEDSASFWPIVESYVAGIFVPCLTADGKNDFLFEYYLGNAILSTNGTFPQGYLYRGLNLGPSQGGASQEFYARLRHWFSLRNVATLEYMHSERGNLGRVKVNSTGQFDPNGTMQAKERRDALRASWRLPVFPDLDLNLMYGYEWIRNMNLVGGANRTNQIISADFSYMY